MCLLFWNKVKKIKFRNFAVYLYWKRKTWPLFGIGQRPKKIGWIWPQFRDHPWSKASQFQIFHGFSGIFEDILSLELEISVGSDFIFVFFFTVFGSFFLREIRSKCTRFFIWILYRWILIPFRDLSYSVELGIHCHWTKNKYIYIHVLFKDVYFLVQES